MRAGMVVPMHCIGSHKTAQYLLIRRIINVHASPCPFAQPNGKLKRGVHLYPTCMASRTGTGSCHCARRPRTPAPLAGPRRTPIRGRSEAIWRVGCVWCKFACWLARIPRCCACAEGGRRQVSAGLPTTCTGGNPGFPPGLRGFPPGFHDKSLASRL